MNAQDYLKARHIELKMLEGASVGRLIIGAEFNVSSKRGVLVYPKHGVVAERYLSLLTEEGIKYVVAEGGGNISFYGIRNNEETLSPFRAIPSTHQRYFPSKEVIAFLSGLLRQLVKRRDNQQHIAADCIVARISDEQQGKWAVWENAVYAPRSECSELLGLSKGLTGISEADIEIFLKFCAIISGFTLIPQCDEDISAIIEWLGQLADGKKGYYGLPVSTSYIFRILGKQASNLTLVTCTIGAQLTALMGVTESTLVIENGNKGVQPVLEKLFPSTHFVYKDYIGFKPKDRPDTTILIPPFGRSFTNKQQLKDISSFFNEVITKQKIPFEYLYILHAIEQSKDDGIIVAVVPEGILSGASHSVFRDWLLKNVQILGVISLPTGYCFEGTALRCSIFCLKKSATLSEDYQITMLELHPGDLTDVKAIEDTKTIIQQMLTPEGHS